MTDDDLIFCPLDRFIEQRKHVQVVDVAKERIDRSPGLSFCWESREDHGYACCIETAHHIGKKQGARSGDRGNPAPLSILDFRRVASITTAKVEDRERLRVLRKASRYIVHGGKRMRSHQFQDANVLVMLFQNFLSAGQAAALRSDSADVVVGNHGGTYIA